MCGALKMMVMMMMFVQVETSDGFLLGMQHIAYGSTDATNSTAPRPPVFLQHGLIQVCRDSISVDSYIIIWIYISG